MPDYDLEQLLMNERLIDYGTETETEAVPEPELPSRIDEKAQIVNKIKECRGNITIAARELGVSRKTLYKKIKKYQITIER